MNVLLWVLLATAVPSPSFPQAAPRVALVAADDDAADEDGDALPDGCWQSWLCYKLPDSETAAPWVADSGFTYILIRDGLAFALSFVGIPFVGAWLPFALHFLYVPEDVRPPMEGPLLTTFAIDIIISFALGNLLIPLLFLPFGFFVYAAVNMVWNYWIMPVTALHAYNTAMSGVKEDDRPRKKKKKSARKKRRRVEEDADDE